MSLVTTFKQISIATGLYRPARRLSRIVRRSERREFLADVELYRSLVPRGALCFDVGANIGAKSEALLSAGERVVAFEPNPLVLPELRARCGHHESWTLVQAALGSGAAIATLYARQSHGQSGLLRDWEGEEIARFQVPVVTLDSAIQCFGIPADCKIDVEGWELEVLLGLTQPIRLVSFEFHLDDDNVQKTIACLRSLARFGRTEVNIAAAETAHFHFRNWMPLDQFVAWFPGDLKQTLTGPAYGDIFARSAAGMSPPTLETANGAPCGS